MLRLHDGKNFCSWSLSFGYFYDSWLYMIILFILISDIIGFFAAVYMPVKIFVHGPVIWIFLWQLVVFEYCMFSDLGVDSFSCCGIYAGIFFNHGVCHLDFIIRAGCT